MILYHYTTEAGYNSIIRDKKLLPSNGFISRDAAYGFGWYMTDFSESQCDGHKVAHCWQTVSQDIFQKTEYYLKFDVADHLWVLGREHVYVIPSTVWTGVLTENWGNDVRLIAKGKTPSCSSAPCWLCNTVSKIKQFFNWL